MYKQCCILLGKALGIWPGVSHCLGYILHGAWKSDECHIEKGVDALCMVRDSS